MDYLGVGKSVFTINLAISFKNKKILIIDLDILNNCLHTILGIKLSNKNKSNFKKYIIKYVENVKENQICLLNIGKKLECLF